MHPANATAEAELPLIDQRAMSDWCDDMDKEDVLAILARVPEEGTGALADFEEGDRRRATSHRPGAPRIA